MNLINSNWKIYLNKEEKILLHTTQEITYKRIYLILDFVMGLLLGFIISAYPSIVIGKLLNRKPVFLIKNIMIPSTILFAILFCIFVYYSYKAVHYAITNNGIYKIYGLLNKKIKFVPYKKITDTSLSIGLIESIISIGTINISTAGGTKMVSGHSQPYELSICHINDYKKVNELIGKNIK